MAIDQSRDQRDDPRSMQDSEGLRPYLEGYSRGDPAVLRALYRRDWRSAALAELHRRHDRLLSVLDDALLERLVSGELDLVAAAVRLAAELEAKMDPAARP